MVIWDSCANVSWWLQAKRKEFADWIRGQEEGVKG